MRGSPASPGMAMVQLHKIFEPVIEVSEEKIIDPDGEMERLHKAMDQCAWQLEELARTQDRAASEIIDFQRLMLEDTDYQGKIEILIRKELHSCEYAVRSATEEYCKCLRSMTDNDYLRERTADFSDLGQRLLRVLAGVETFPEPKDAYIAVAVDLTPSQVVGMDTRKVKGIVLEGGAPTAHAVIIAKSLDIPCLINTSGVMDGLTEGEVILLDGFTGEVITNPSQEQVQAFRTYEGKRRDELQALEDYCNRATCTVDNWNMKIYANISTPRDVKRVVSQGGEGVGLYRTELLYMEEAVAPPSEEKQFQAYTQAAKGLEGRPLIIRTLDVGGDKKIPYLDIPPEENPFLGYRAIRYCLDNQDLFRTQLTAVLRASAYGKIALMFPMITCMQELWDARALVEECKDDLRKKGIAFDKAIKTGMMIETPAVAQDAERFAREADFFSIGTNDLAQYLFAADRVNPKVCGLNSYYQPGLLRAMAHVAAAARQAGIEVGICGRAGEIKRLVPLWVGMGIDELSVSPPSVARLRRVICNLYKSTCEELVDRVLQADTKEEVERLLDAFHPREEGKNDYEAADGGK